MPNATQSLFRYVLDTCALIDIAGSEKMTVLRKVVNDIIIPQKVAEEIKRPPSLKRFIKSHPEVVVEFDEKEGEQYLELLERYSFGKGSLGKGEVAAITISYNRDIPLVTDDTTATKKAKELGIKKILTYKGFLKQYDR